MPEIPLSGWTDRNLKALAASTECDAIARLSGAGLLGQRAMLNGFSVPGQTSAGGGCRLSKARDGWVALNLARDADRELLPALFGDADFVESELEERIARSERLPLVAKGRALGMAIAATGESNKKAARNPLALASRPKDNLGKPLVIDLSSLWAGPLASHLLQLAGADVIKLESAARPDSMREGDSKFFSALNDGKEHRRIDFSSAEFIALLEKADIVIEASRPRALLQLGIDAEALVRAKPSMLWLSITAHGNHNWVGFGDDVGIAAGLTDAMMSAGGNAGFVGDAIGDPLTGIVAARLIWERWSTGEGGRIFLPMREVVSTAIADEQTRDAAAFAVSLRDWSAAKGEPFPC